MKRIAIDARELGTSTGRYVERLLHYLQKLDAKHEYLVLLSPASFEGWRPANSRFTKVLCPYKEFSFGEQLGFARQLGGLKADLVHFGMVQQPVLYRGRSVTTIHDLTTARFPNPAKNPVVFKIKQAVYRRVIKVAARKAARVIAPSKFVARDVAKYAGISSSKITVTYEAADTITDAAAALPRLEGKQFIMYVGRPTPHKNLERLIEAFGRLKAKQPGLVLVLAGKKDANYRRIESMVQKRAVPDVIFTGFVDEGQLRWLYENCSAYVFPSLSEGFGLPGLEAMAHGAPVVSSNATCLPEIYGEAAHYFDPLGSAAMASAINDVLTGEALRDRLIQKGRAQVRQYSWQRMAEQTLAVYNEILAIGPK